jgi:multiple sugar transport system permease protein
MMTRLILRALAIVLLVALCVYFLVPLVWLLLAPTKTPSQLVNDDPFAFGSFAQIATSWHRVMAFENGALLVWLKNSVFYAVASVVIAGCACVGAGYALSMFDFPGRKVLLWATLIVMLMPGTVLVLPVFLELSAGHLIDSPWAVILPSAFFPFGVYLMYLYFRSVFSRDLAASARLDGASELQVFLHMGVPLSGPMVALVGFFAFVAQWNNYFLPLVVLPTSDLFPLPVGLAQLASVDISITPQLTGSQIYNPELALATLVTMAPILLVLVLAQRFVIRGASIMSGAMTG